MSQLLATKRISVNAGTSTGQTALMVAAEEGESEIVAQLLEAPEINVNAANINGSTALMIAQRYSDPSVRRMSRHEDGARHSKVARQLQMAQWTALMRSVHTKCLDLFALAFSFRVLLPQQLIYGFVVGSGFVSGLLLTCTCT